MLARPGFDLGRLARLAKATGLADLTSSLGGGLPRMPGLADAKGLDGGSPGLAGDLQSPALAPALRDMLARLGELKPGSPLCGMAMRGGAEPAVAVPEGARFAEFIHRGAAGALAYKLYVPRRSAGQAMPLVVMLHGCTQSPDDFAAGTRMNALAEEQGILVAYPRQTQGANAQKCWNWFDAKDQGRDRGEPALIAGLTRDIIRDVPVDASRVYVAGLSAGGAAAAIMGQCYPELYAAVGVHSGLAAGAAHDMPGAFAAMRGQGSSTAGRAVPTVVFHGDADRTVHPSNGERVAEQGRGGVALVVETTQGRSDGGIAYTLIVESDASGLPMLERWALHGAAHAWSGGSLDGSYTEPRGPDASREMLRFFLRHRLIPAEG